VGVEDGGGEDGERLVPEPQRADQSAGDDDVTEQPLDRPEVVVREDAPGSVSGSSGFRRRRASADQSPLTAARDEEVVEVDADADDEGPPKGGPPGDDVRERGAQTPARPTASESRACSREYICPENTAGRP